MSPARLYFAVLLVFFLFPPLAFGQDNFPQRLQGLANNIVVDTSGNRYISGFFAGSTNFNTDGGTDVKISAGAFDAFVTRLNADGSYGWTQTFGGTGSDSWKLGTVTYYDAPK